MSKVHRFWKDSQTIHTHIIFCRRNSSITPKEITEPQQDLRSGRVQVILSILFFTRKITSNILIFIHWFPILFVSYFLNNNLNKIPWLHRLLIDLQNAICLPFNISLQYFFFQPIGMCNKSSFTFHKWTPKCRPARHNYYSIILFLCKLIHRKVSKLLLQLEPALWLCHLFLSWLF